MVLQIVLFLVLNLGFQLLGAQNLQVGFYKDKCEDAELIVKEEVEKAFFDKDYGIAPGLIRLHFHDSFVRVHCCTNPQLPPLFFFFCA